MDLSKYTNEDLLETFAKRQADLIVMGINIGHNRKAPTHPDEIKGFNSRIKSLIVTAEELTRRKQHIKLDLAKQHPFVQKRIAAAIKKSTLLRRLPMPPKALPPKRKLTPHRRP